MDFVGTVFRNLLPNQLIYHFEKFFVAPSGEVVEAGDVHVLHDEQAALWPLRSAQPQLAQPGRKGQDTPKQERDVAADTEHLPLLLL